MLSSTTADEEETDNDAYTATADQNSVAPSVPMTVEWHGPGNKIFVTGTFVQWDRKFKLHRDKEKGGFHATLQLRPGTHHLKFLVDGDMITSNDLPTTVDYTISWSITSRSWLRSQQRLRSSQPFPPSRCRYLVQQSQRARLLLWKGQQHKRFLSEAMRTHPRQMVAFR